MATYVSKKCPYCGYTYQQFKSGEQRKYGCPLLLCPKCNHSFWDLDIVEPALHGYENTYEKTNRVIWVISMIFFSCVAAFLIGFGIYGLTVDKEYSFLGLLFGGILVFFLYISFSDYLDKKRHPEKHIPFQQIWYDASKERLQNTQYLIALSEKDKLAKVLLDERLSGLVEHYAPRPEMPAQAEKPSRKKVDRAKHSVSKGNEGCIRLAKKGKTAIPASQNDPLETIEKLKKMYDDNILTQEEFEEKKAELLKRL